MLVNYRLDRVPNFLGVFSGREQGRVRFAIQRTLLPRVQCMFFLTRRYQPKYNRCVVTTEQ